MINKVELGSVNSRYKTPQQHEFAKNKGQQVGFTGVGNLALKSIQLCESKPMLNVAVLDFSTAIIPRTFFETFIGSKQKDENGNETDKRKLNIMGGFEAFRREASGLFINCLIPGFVVKGVSKLFNRSVMGSYNKSNLTSSWANSSTIDRVQDFYASAKGSTKEDKIYSSLKSMFDHIEGVDGDISNGGLKKFGTVLSNDSEYLAQLRKTAKEIASEKPKAGYMDELYNLLVKKTGISENIRFAGDKGFSSSNLGHLVESAGDLLHGAVKEGIIKDGADVVGAELPELSRYFSKAKRLVNVKSFAGLGVIIPLAIAAQPINRWITHKMSGKKGAPIYNDNEDRVLTPEEKAKLTARKFIDIPLMWGVAGLSMMMDRPSLKMLQFKNIFPTMDQARLISAATFSSRLAAAEDTNELQENTIRDIATFSSFYFLGDYAAKAIATYLENTNKDGIKLINRLKTPKEGANILQKFWNWAKHTHIKSTDELGAIADEVLRTKAKNLRATCQLGNLAFSLLSLGVFIPLYTRTQTNKKMQMKAKMNEANQVQTTGTMTFTQNILKNDSQAFRNFVS